MRRLLMIASATAITLASAPASYAQSRGNDRCPPGLTSCAVEHTPPAPAHGTGPSAERRDENRGREHRTAPRPGESGWGGQRFERAGSSRFKAPPRGQEYRVINEHLVLVDSNTLKVVAVLGLLNTLLK